MNEVPDSAVRAYESRIDSLLGMPWRPDADMAPEQFDDLSAVRECFDADRYLNDNPAVAEAIAQGLVGSPWEHWTLYGQMQRRFARFKLPFQVFNDRHAGEHVYVIADNAFFSTLAPPIRKAIEDRVSIALPPFDFHFGGRYQLVTDRRDYLIATKMSSRSCIILLRPFAAPAEALQTLAAYHIDLLQDGVFERRGLPRYLTSHRAPLFGAHPFIAAIHLAFVMGARTIVMIGDAPDVGAEGSAMPAVFSAMRRHGVEILATTAGGRLAEWNAVFTSIDDCLSHA